MKIHHSYTISFVLSRVGKSLYKKQKRLHNSLILLKRDDKLNV